MAEVRDEESEMAKELRELRKLRDDGVIDESLFMEKSRQVLGLPALPAKRQAPPADTLPPKKKATPAATPQPAQPASIDLTNDTEAAPPPPPPPAVPPPVAPPAVAPPAAPPVAPPAAPPAPAIVQPPRGISTNRAAMARYNRHERDLLQARDDWEAFLSADNVDSGDDNESPKQMTGYFPDWENVKYLELLNKYGEPKKANPEALRAFMQEFCYRKKASITSHPSHFNKGAYDAWRAANGGKWVGFTWTAPNGL